MKPQPKKTMLEFLKQTACWYSGAELEDMDFGGKKSATGRALRRLYSEGKLERKYEKLANRNDEQVFYRFKPYPDTLRASVDAFKVEVDKRAGLMTLPPKNLTMRL